LSDGVLLISPPASNETGPTTPLPLNGGEFSSIRAAAIAAGIVKPPTPLDTLRKAWAKASRDERAFPGPAEALANP
jgi:hypothetical protein